MFIWRSHTNYPQVCPDEALSATESEFGFCNVRKSLDIEGHEGP